MSAVDNTRIIKNTILLYFRMFFTMGISLYTSRIVLGALGIEDFGIYNVVGGVVAVFGFINVAMSSSTARFLTFELGRNDAIRLKKVFSISLILHLFIALLVALFAELLGEWFLETQMQIPVSRLQAAKWVFHCSVFATCCSIVVVPYMAAIVAHEKFGTFAYLTILDVVLKLLIVYFLLCFSFDKLKMYALLLLVAQLIVQGGYVIYGYHKFHEARGLWVWERQLFKEMSGFAGWSLFGDLSFIAFTQGINILLNIFFGPVVNAARGIAVQVQSAVNSFSTNFQTALNPQITKTYAAGDINQMHKLIYASSKYSFFLLFFLSLPILIETPQIIFWWLNKVPEHTVNFVRIILCITLIDGIANPLIISAKATGKIRLYQMVVGSLLLLILPFSYLALKLNVNAEGVFIVHFIIALLAQIARIWILKSLIYLSVRDYFHQVVMRIVSVAFAACLLPCFLSYYLPSGSFYTLMICATSLFSCAFVIYFIGLGSAERLFVNQKIQAVTNKMKR
jgi:O-antigen/teichoic acid export membrane protein